MPAVARRPCIALLVNSLDSAYQTSLRTAIGRVAARRGVDLWVVLGRELEQPDDGERALNVIYDWIRSPAIDGAILIAGAMANFVGSEGITRLCRSLAPVKTCSIALVLPDVPSIILDNRAAMRANVEHLLKVHRCRRIAYVGGPSHNEEARDRLAGYRDALAAAGVPVDEALIGAGHFSLSTGRAALVDIQRRTRDIDGVVAANDYMALGAMDELFHQGIRVPEDVPVMGFDNTPVARFAQRSLSTMAQPIDEISERAVDTILRSLEGKSTEPVTVLDVQLVLRESCGCGYAMGATVPPHAMDERGDAARFLRRSGPALAKGLLESAGSSRRYWESFLRELIDALADELAGKTGSLVACIEALADHEQEGHGSLDEVARALVQLRGLCRAAGYHGVAHIKLEQACLEALTVLASAATRREGRHTLDVLERAYGLRPVSQALAMGLNRTDLARSFVKAIPSIGVDTAYLAVILPGSPPRFQTLLAYERGEHVSVDLRPHPPERLFAPGFPSGRSPSSLLLLPLTYEREVLGLVAFDGEADSFICEAVRAQLSASIKLAALHGRVVEETALRERLARERLQGELAVGRRIQTALIPRQIEVPGLEIAAGMVPADQVGGDYYDIVPTSDGCWLTIGDVTGHGLLAGMIMLMMQSAVSTILEVSPDCSPARLVSHLNAVMTSNIRARLGESEHATFVALRYRSGGRITMAGAHEELVLYRAAERRCERLPQSGIWLGIAADIEAQTSDQSFTLAAGDVLLLYTDGLIEARSATKEELGLERVEQILSANASAPVQVIYDQLLAAAHEWTPVQQDDITLVVLRRVF
jgi:DNA-binding LacI/PurR family transcriptional regulator/serine phosphatase RsbU (regulator of sigma subunit)